MKTSLTTSGFRPVNITLTIETQREKLLWIALTNKVALAELLQKDVNSHYVLEDEPSFQLDEIDLFLKALNVEF